MRCAGCARKTMQRLSHDTPAELAKSKELKNRPRISSKGARRLLLPIPRFPFYVRDHFFAASMRAHAVAQGAEPKSSDLKNWPKNVFGRLRKAFFSRFLGFPLNATSAIYFISTCEHMRTRCTGISRIRGEAMSSGFKGMGRRWPLEAQNTPPLANFPIPAHTRHRRLRADGGANALKELAEDGFLRAQNAFFSQFLQFSACEPM